MDTIGGLFFDTIVGLFRQDKLTFVTFLHNLCACVCHKRCDAYREEEDTCVSYEEEDTFFFMRRRIHVCHKRYDAHR